MMKINKSQDMKAMYGDGWLNLFAGIGGKMDKRKETYFSGFEFLPDEMLADIYAGEGLASSIIDIVADDMTKEWIFLDGEDDKVNEDIMDVLGDLNAEYNFNQAIKWQRLFGGSILFLGVMDGNKPDKPVNMNKIKNIEFLKPIDKSDIEISQSIFQKDPTKPRFGKVEKYKVRMYIPPTGDKDVDIHASRTISFFGKQVPRIATNIDQDLRYWGAGCLQDAWEDLKDMGGIRSSVANLLYELVIGVFRFDNLQEMLADGNEQLVITRMEIINMAKSIINAVLLGKDEDFDRNTANVSGISDIIDRFMMMVSASVRIPITRLFGRSPAGENATGEGDMNNYYDMVRSKQKNELLDAIQYLVNLISIMLNVQEPPRVVFNPLEQMSEKEKSEINKMNAETDQIYMQNGVLTGEDVQQMRFPKL